MKTLSRMPIGIDKCCSRIRLRYIASNRSARVLSACLYLTLWKGVQPANSPELNLAERILKERWKR